MILVLDGLMIDNVSFSTEFPPSAFRYDGLGNVDYIVGKRSVVLTKPIQEQVFISTFSTLVVLSQGPHQKLLTAIAKKCLKAL